MRISCILTEVLLCDLRFWRLRASKSWIFWHGALWNVVDGCQRVGGTRHPLLQDRSYHIKSSFNQTPGRCRILSDRCGQEITLGTSAKLNPDSPVVQLVCSPVRWPRNFVCYLYDDSRWCHWNFQWHIPSDRTMALGSTQPLVKMSTRNISWG